MNIEDESRPSSFKAVYFIAAILIHIVLFVSIWFIGMREEEKDEEVAVPMELMVVVHENLDGEENEPPPDTPPVSQPDPPPPDPPKDPDPPPRDEPDIADAVVLQPDKPKPPKPPEPPKPPAPPKPPKPTPPKQPDPPKKPDKPKEPQETLDQRLARMRNSTTKVKTPPPRNNGRTDKRPANWNELLNAGYKPGPTNQGLDANEKERCLALIREAFYSKWERPAWTSSMGKMHLEVRFGSGGKVLGYKLTQGSGDSSADRTVLNAASKVSAVRGLSPSFLENNKTVTVRFEVTPN